MNINTFGPPLAKNTKFLENGDNKTKAKPRTFEDSISLLTLNQEKALEKLWFSIIFTNWQEVFTNRMTAEFRNFNLK